MQVTLATSKPFADQFQSRQGGPWPVDAASRPRSPAMRSRAGEQHECHDPEHAVGRDRYRSVRGRSGHTIGQ